MDLINKQTFLNTKIFSRLINSFSKRFIICGIFLFLNTPGLAETLKNESFNQEKLIPNSEYLQRLPNINFYILGPGDTIRIKVSEDSKELDSFFTINGEGVANLKRLKRVFVSGLTIAELTKILNKEYSKFVKDPQRRVDLISQKN